MGWIETLDKYATHIWRLDDADDVARPSKGGLAGAYENTPTRQVPGLLPGVSETDTAVQFDGISQNVSIPDDGSLSLAANFSFGAWIKPTSVTSFQTPMRKGNNYGLYLDSSGFVYFVLFTLDQGNAGVRAPVVSGNTYFVGAEFDGLTMSIYLNGVLTDDFSFTTFPSLTITGDDLLIGTSPLGDYYEGVVDEAFVKADGLIGADGWAELYRSAQTGPAVNYKRRRHRYAIDTATTIPNPTDVSVRDDFVIVQGWRTDIRDALKAANPNVKVLAYLNVATMIGERGENGYSSTGVNQDQAQTDETLWLHDKNGQRIFSYTYDWLALGNIGSPNFQSIWKATALTQLPGWDGVFADDTNGSVVAHHDPDDVQEYADDAAYQAAMTDFAKNVFPFLQSKGYMVIPNMSGTWASYKDFADSLLPYVDGGFNEFAVKWGVNNLRPFQYIDLWNNNIDSAELCEVMGKWFLWSSPLIGDGDPFDAYHYAYASYLLAANGRTSFAAQVNYHDDSPVYPEYGYDIGFPTGPRQQVEDAGPNVWMRKYERGIAVVNADDRNATIVELDGSYTGSGLVSVSTLAMGPQSGVILVKDRVPTPSPVAHRNQVIRDLSGVVVNQNVRPGAADYVNRTDWTYQEFFLPSNYKRGTAEDGSIPPLSGFQLFVGTQSVDASFDYTVEYQVFGVGWLPLTQGTATGVNAISPRIWMTAYFDNPAPVTEDMLTSRFRIGIKPGVDVDKLWFSAPNPLAAQFAQAYDADGETPLLRGFDSAPFSLLFRVLGLTADEGIDFLGNTYRSYVAFSDNSGTQQNWLSKPNPSRFAVENLYYDLRPIKLKTTYGTHNLHTNSGAESGDITPGWRDPGGSGGSVTNFNVVNTDARHGQWCWEFSGVGGSSWPVYFFGQQLDATAGETYFLRASVKVVTGTPTSIELRMRGQTGGAVVEEVLVDIVNNPSNGQWYDLFGTVTVPDGCDNFELEVMARDLAGLNFTLHYDDLMIVKDPGTDTPAYFDGTMPGYTWGNGIFSDSIQEIEPPIDDVEEAVIDKVLVDPLTPGVYFSIYYTSEGNPGTTVDEWDEKLWTRVPQTFHATKREAHVLPAPIRARYIKLEFTHLQAKSYNPGNFAKPVKYKKHPKWVLDYFLARLASQQAVETQLTGRVAVLYDALDLAYSYYLDDLDQTPTTPFEVNPSFQSTISKYLSDTSDASDKLDPQMLDKIKLAMQPYQNPPSRLSDPSTVLGAQVIATDAQALTDPQTEASNIVFPDVGQLLNEQVIFESDYPVMFFFLTCRHAYREIVAGFDTNKAYFVGVKEVAFTRENYTVAYDSDLYIEPHGDLVNTERNDFTQVDGNLAVQ